MFEEKYATLEEIPEAVKHLYREVSGEYVLIKASEVKTVDDINRLQESLRKERSDHKETKQKLNAFNGLEPDEVHEKLDRIDELEAAAGDKLDDNKINEMVETRIRSRLAPVERKLNAVTQERDDLSEQVNTFQKKDRTRIIHDYIRKAATATNMQATAIEDALLLGDTVFELDESGKPVTIERDGITPGVGPDVWLSEIKSVRPHWWPESKGVGAKGGSGGPSGNNPWSKEGWNLTEQGRMYKEDKVKAEQMARAAGTTIASGRPQ